MLSPKKVSYQANLRLTLRTSLATISSIKRSYNDNRHFRGGLMKLGSHVASLQAARKAPYAEGIQNAGRLGFDGVELIAMSRVELDEYYTRQTCASLRRLAAEHHLEISQFALYSTACEGMASLEP